MKTVPLGGTVYTLKSVFDNRPHLALTIKAEMISEILELYPTNTADSSGESCCNPSPREIHIIFGPRFEELF
jgi:hypothetical protein